SSTVSPALPPAGTTRLSWGTLAGGAVWPGRRGGRRTGRGCMGGVLRWGGTRADPSVKSALPGGGSYLWRPAAFKCPVGRRGGPRGGATEGGGEGRVGARRRASRQHRGDGRMVLEGIVTTIAPEGTLNVAPMGPIVEPDMRRLVFRPFNTSQTYRNLKAHGEG